MALNIMVVEDDPTLARAIERHLGRHGTLIHVAATLAEARAALETKRFHAAIVDVGLPDGDGLEVLQDLPAHQRPAIIVMTGDATVDVAVDALRMGAVDFLLKPFSMAALDAAVARVLATPRGFAAQPAEPAAADGWRRQHAPQMLGEHPTLLRVFELISRVSDTDCSILLQGETGTGKELVARSLHSSSGRGNKPFVAVNCAAMPENLMESELFGHARGAFTGAVTARHGRFVLADGGTLFLDEIGEMPLSVQAKLLRALQEKEITPVGESKAVKVDVRIVAATHRDLEEMVSQKLFREDLLYRLDVVRVRLPSLRQRASDVALLVREFIQSTNERRNRHVTGIDPEAVDILSRYPWPGNVRQLQNIIERMVLLRAEGQLNLEDVPESILMSVGAAPAAPPSFSALDRPSLPEEGLDLRDTVERFESSLIEQALERAGGNKSRAATILRMNRTTLVEKLRKRGFVDDGG